MREKLKDICDRVGLSYEYHDSHGFCINAHLGDKWITLDPTPESTYKDGICVKSYPVGTLLVYSNGEIVLLISLLMPSGYEILEIFLRDLFANELKEILLS